MPTTTLVPTSLTDSNSNVAAGAYTDVDNTIASASGTTLDSVTDEWTPASNKTNAITFGLSDLPANADSVNTVQFRVRARVTGDATSNTLIYQCDVQGTNKPSTAVTWDAFSDNNNGFENRGDASPVTTSASVANVNGWSIRVFQDQYNQLSGVDNLNLEIDEIEIVVDYNLAPPSPGSRSPDATNPYTVIPTTDTVISGLCITNARDFVIIGGLYSDRFAIRWCDIGDPTSWSTPATDAARAAQAGSQTFPSRFGNVTGLAGNDFYFYIFQEKAVSKATYVGGDTVWSFDIFEEDRGCVRQGRLVAIDDRVFFQSAKGYHMLMNDQITDIGFGSVSDSFG